MRECTVLAKIDESQLIKIHYDGFDASYDEWIEETHERINEKFRAKPHTYEI